MDRSCGTGATDLSMFSLFMIICRNLEYGISVGLLDFK